MNKRRENTWLFYFVQDIAMALKENFSMTGGGIQ
jgi:hypothetical protein